MDHPRKLLGLAVFFAAVLLGCSKPAESPKTGEPKLEASANSESRIRVSRPDTEASEPVIAVGANGKLYVGYVEKASDGKSDLYVRTVDQAKILGEPVLVNPEHGQVKTWYGDPPTMAVAPDGTIYVGWTAIYPDSKKGTLLFVSASHDGGATFAEPVKVHSDTAPASHGMHSLAVAPDGRIIAAWLDERYLNAATSHAGIDTHHTALLNATPTPTTSSNEEAEPDAELYFSVSSDGGKTFAADHRIDTHVCPCCKASIAIGNDGSVYVGYRRVYEGSLRHITIAASKDWQTFAQPVQVSDDRWKIEACPVSGPALRFDNGRLAVAWYFGGEARDHGMYLANASSVDARTFDVPQKIDTFEGGGTPAWAGDQLLWSNDGNIRTSIAGSPVSTQGEGRNIAAARTDRNLAYAFVSVAESKKSIWIEIR
ncbi:MAG: sialidase family protein [Pyrinomonadaceae bacterium]